MMVRWTLGRSAVAVRHAARGHEKPDDDRAHVRPSTADVLVRILRSARFELLRKIGILLAPKVIETWFFISCVRWYAPVRAAASRASEARASKLLTTYYYFTYWLFLHRCSLAPPRDGARARARRANRNPGDFARDPPVLL